MHSIVLRRALAPSLHLAALWSGHALRRAKAVRRPRILMYHSVGHEDVSIRQFRWQLQFLRDEFELLPLTRLIDRLRADALSGDEVALSFDDGVRNHHSVVWPLLREARAPAAFFVCPGLIDSGAWLWNTELRARLLLLNLPEREQLATEAGCPAMTVEAMIGWAKRLPLAQRQDFEEKARARTREFQPTAAQIDRNAPMTWPQLRQLDARLIEIGCHTATHPILTTLPPDSLRTEIVDSRRALEQRSGRNVELFCYPNGANDAAVRAVVREVYRAALSTREDVVSADADVYALPRVPAGDRNGYFVRRLHRPAA